MPGSRGDGAASGPAGGVARGRARFTGPLALRGRMGCVFMGAAGRLWRRLRAWAPQALPAASPRCRLDPRSKGGFAPAVGGGRLCARTPGHRGVRPVLGLRAGVVRDDPGAARTKAYPGGLGSLGRAKGRRAGRAEPMGRPVRTRGGSRGPAGGCRKRRRRRGCVRPGPGRSRGGGRF